MSAPLPNQEPGSHCCLFLSLPPHPNSHICWAHLVNVSEPCFRGLAKKFTSVSPVRTNFWPAQIFFSIPCLSLVQGLSSFIWTAWSHGHHHIGLLPSITPNPLSKGLTKWTSLIFNLIFKSDCIISHFNHLNSVFQKPFESEGTSFTNQPYLEINLLSWE